MPGRCRRSTNSCWISRQRAAGTRRIRPGCGRPARKRCSGLTQGNADEPGSARRLTVSARRSSGVAELEFIAASDQENLEDRIAYLNELTEVPNEEDIALRLLRRYASSVEHRKYYGIDIIAVRVEQTRVTI